MFSEFPFTNSNFILNISLSLKQIHEGNKTEIWFLKFTTVNVKLKGIFSDSNNIFLRYESEDINKKSLFPKFLLIPILRFQVTHYYVYFIAPIDYCVE